MHIHGIIPPVATPMKADEDLAEQISSDIERRAVVKRARELHTTTFEAVFR